MTQRPEGTKEGSRWQAAKRCSHRNCGRTQRAPAGAQERVLRPLRGRTFIAHHSGGRAASRLATGYLLSSLRDTARARASTPQNFLSENSATSKDFLFSSVETAGLETILRRRKDMSGLF